MGYLVRYRSEEGVRTELAFSGRHAKEDALAHAQEAIKQGSREVEVLENGKPIPKSEYAKGRK